MQDVFFLIGYWEITYSVCMKTYITDRFSDCFVLDNCLNGLFLLTEIRISLE